MNISGPFVKDILLSKSKGDVTSLEERVKPHLVVASLQKKKLKNRVDKFNLKSTNQKEPLIKHLLKQNDYKLTSKISKISLNSFIKTSNKSVKKAEAIVKKYFKDNNKSLSKEDKYKYIQENHPEIFLELPVSYRKMYESLYLLLWVPYIQQVLKIDIQKPYRETLNQLNLQVCLLKLVISDFNGSKIKIIKSENNSMLGKEGIVIWDSQKSFIVICKNAKNSFDQIQILPKKKSIFEIRVPISEQKDETIFHIIGDRFQHRSSDRVGKKFKNKNVKDLDYYIFNEDLYNSSSSS